MDKYINLTRLTETRLVNQGPTLFYGCLAEIGSDTGDVRFYDGSGVESGSLKLLVDVHASLPQSLVLPHPVLFDRGLYALLGAACTGVTILWKDYTPTTEQLINP